ncbi:MAG: hypothetical protein QM582_06180 [Micropruina sp.]
MPAARIGTVRDHTGRLAAAALLAEIWGVPTAESPVPADLMTALDHAGGCVLGAWNEAGELVGVTIGLAGAPRSERVYSYIAGVSARFAGRGLGRQLKLAQRDWALERGATVLTWTYDPLIRRNGHFNLNRLGGRVTDFVADYYPPMADAVNAGDLPDRFVVDWTLTEPPSGRPLPPGASEAAVVLGPGGQGLSGPDAAPPAPALRLDEASGPVLRVWVPLDIEALRRADADLGRHWRLAAREAFTTLFAQGYRPVGIDADGHYVVVKEA